MQFLGVVSLLTQRKRTHREGRDSLQTPLLAPVGRGEREEREGACRERGHVEREEGEKERSGAVEERGSAG